MIVRHRREMNSLSGQRQVFEQPKPLAQDGEVVNIEGAFHVTGGLQNAQGDRRHGRTSFKSFDAVSACTVSRPRENASLLGDTASSCAMRTSSWSEHGSRARSITRRADSLTRWVLMVP